MNEKSALHLSLSWRTLAILLLVIIAIITYLWKPWAINAAAARTITVQGSATVSAVPDTYAFQPVFENSDVKVLTATGNAAVAALKKLGVKDEDIKTTISAATADIKPMPAEMGSPAIQSYPYRNTSTYLIMVTVHDKALAQKVSDYLATTSATGQITPSASFSKATQNKLDLSARSEAADDAKAKASVTAKQLGASVGKVIKISEASWPGVYATDSAGSVPAPQAKSTGGPTVEPGLGEVSYSFTVEFELKNN
jgi:uncharacterized protein YggE